MKSLLLLAAAIGLSGTAFSQVLSEDFSSGVPPAGWTHVNNNGSATVGWIPDATGRAWHEDESSSLGTADNTLVSPVMDLTGITGTTLTFDGETNYAPWLANHPSSIGDGISNMEISTDGGLTWTVVWTDTSLNSGDTYTPCADLSAWDGMANVQLGIHFYGTWAQEWWVDNIVVDGGGCGGGGFTLSSTPLVRGANATVTLTGATPGGYVLIGYSFVGAGPSWTPFGMVDINAPITTLPVQLVDASGNVTITAGVASQVGTNTLYAQAVDLTTGTLSNSIAEPIL